MTQQLIGDYARFLDQLFGHLDSAQIKGAELLALDHLAYRVETWERYQELKENLSHDNTLVSEAEINGRPIAVFKLAKPLKYENFIIPALELPAPSSTPYPEGLEHAEFIVADLHTLMQRHAELNFITKDLNKEINPEIALKFPGCAAKFHLRPLLEVVRLQEETGQL